ncbi:MAG: glucuronate isomerase [Clostridia bacterium]|nr:glucuronate isomerase [Clostridia bacterium]
MKKFMDKDFLLKTKSAKKIYNTCKDLPIIDYHCHVSPKEIYLDKHFSSITEVWLSGDHYKWRLMRAFGINEYYITGNATAKEKFLAFASVLPKAIGNPMYHWCHLELKKYFGYDGVLNADTAETVWQLANQKLADPSMGVRGIINKSNVKFIGTTDDPIDDLIYHKKLSEDKDFSVIVAPSFRPDKALNVDKAGWIDYINKLSTVSNVKIDGIDTLKQALKDRLDYFVKVGCKATDHGLDYAFYNDLSDKDADAVIKKALKGKPVTKEEAEGLKTNLLVFLAGEYCKHGLVMQIHYNCIRNPNTKMMEVLGPDTGFDIIGPNNGSRLITALLDKLYYLDILPRTVLYSLDGNDNAFLDTLIGAFQGTDIACKIQHGSAWWFNDHKLGMEAQLLSLANLSALGNFIGMLTDSRSFLSYTRHEYFRRILCNVLGDFVENGEYPKDYKALTDIAQGISYYNAEKYFGLE